MPKKTVNIADILEYVNNLNKSDKVDQNAKQALNMLLEKVLHDSDNYEGYRYVHTYAKDNEESRFYMISKTIGPQYRVYDAIRHNNNGSR